jgi:hypothetical protein
VQCAVGVPDEANRDVLGTGRNLQQRVSSGCVGSGSPVEVRQCDDRPGEGLAGFLIPYRAGDGRLSRLHGEEDVSCCEDEAHTRLPACPLISKILQHFRRDKGRAYRTGNS